MHARLANRTRYGFTLLELIVGLVVIGVLAALAVPTLSAVRGRSALEVEEAGLAAIARAAYAHARLGDPSATSYTAADLEAVTAPDAQASESLQLRRTGRSIREGVGGFSTATQAIHASIRPDGSVGLAVYVPQAAACACAHAAGPGRGFAVDTWSVKGAAVFECAGNVAAGGPSGTKAGMLLAPPTPSGLRIVDGTVSWDANVDVVVWDIWCAGEHLGETTTTSFDVGTCDEGDVLVTARASGLSQPGWDGGPSTVDPAPREIGGAAPSDTARAASSGAISVTWDTSAGTDTDTYSLDRSTDGGTTWTTVATGVTGGAYVDRTAPTDTSVTYRATGPSGPVETTAYTPTSPTAAPATDGPALTNGTVSDDGWLGVDVVDGDAYLNWRPVADTPQAPLDGYRLYRADAPGADWTTATRVHEGTGTSYVDPQLADGSWCWRVSAYGPGGESGLSSPVCTVVESPASQTFTYTGAAQTFTVPAGVTAVNIEANGGRGGGHSAEYESRGGRTVAAVAVTPGEVLHVYVGGNGIGRTGGWNGGGRGGFGENSYYGNGGGGASDVRIGGTTLDHRVVVAGGGGGAGCGSNTGGPGGGLSGGDGASGYGYPGGTGATQTSGNALGVGGAGGDGSGYTYRGGGGGGGGYWGGTGAPRAYQKCAGGGGGGSGYAAPDATNVTLTTGGSTAPSVVIGWVE